MRRHACQVFLLLLAGVLTGVLTGACSEPTPTAPNEQPADTGYLIDAESGEVSASIRTENGLAVMRSGSGVPVRLPAGFTVYPGARIISNTVFAHGDAAGSLVIMQSDAAPDVMAQFYRRQAAAAGIPIELELNAGGGSLIGGKGPHGRRFSFNANRDGGVTSAELNVGQLPAD